MDVPDPRPSIFITGAGTGIGRAVAERFAKAGWFVGLYDIDETSVQRLREKIGLGRCHAGQMDVAAIGDWNPQLAEFWELAGHRMDLLFNNAGIAVTSNFEEADLARQHRLIDINFKGVLNGCHAALPYLKQTPGARVVNMCSASAFYGQPMMATYSATKAAVRSLTEALDIEWKRHGVRVVDAMPLFVRTAMMADEISKMSTVYALGVRLKPDDVAKTVWRIAHATPRRMAVHWPVGTQTWFFYLLSKLSPTRLTRWFTARMSGY